MTDEYILPRFVFPSDEDPGPTFGVYIAGPMTGIKEFNAPMFDWAAMALADIGIKKIFNPAQHDRDTYNLRFDGLTGHEDLSYLGLDRRVILAADLAWIAEHADALYLLEGWENSSGARAEVALAEALGLHLTGAYKPCEDSDDLGPCDGAEQTGPYVSVDAMVGTETRTTSATGGQKGVKQAQYDQFPTAAIDQIAKVYGFGAAKYDAHNFRKGYEWSKSFSALQRHLWAFWSGEDTDLESGLPHMAHAGWHCLALLSFMDEHPEYDDRYRSRL